MLDPLPMSHLLLLPRVNLEEMERLLWLAETDCGHEAWPHLGQSLWCSRLNVQEGPGTHACVLDPPLRPCSLVLNSVLGLTLHL